MSFPIISGIYNEIDTLKHCFHFNLNHEIIRIRDKSGNWNHPHEWLNRTVGNDWVYNSTGGYTGVFEATGEYYLPNFPYSSNSILGGKPFANEAISSIIDNWSTYLNQLIGTITESQEDIAFLSSVLENSPIKLLEKTKKFHNITGGQISVLPPDARHVGYNIIPVMISKGCIYKCRFCKVKNKHPFHELDQRSIDLQLQELKELYSKDLVNYNSIYLGEHDALRSSTETIVYGIKKAFSTLELYNSYLDGMNCFLFGSVTSLLEAPEDLFFELQKLPCNTYINIGLESPDQETLDRLGKPITSSMVLEAFQRIQFLNNAFPKIELTANLVMDSTLPPSHYQETEKLLRGSQRFQQNKGTIYFSPLCFDSPSRARLFEFNRLKLLSRYPTYLYIIQRL
ncbi:radical SAM protein [Desulforhopalus sp. 52FAK]